MERVRVTRWNQARLPNEQQLRGQMELENLMPYAWSNRAGDVYPPHTHPYDKVIYVAKGSIVWILPETGQEVETRTGDRLELPSGVAHAARVGPEGVTCLEAHLSPASDN